MRTTQDIIRQQFPDAFVEPHVPAPRYIPREGPRVALAVPSMEKHTSDEGWQLALALQAAGYELHGHGLGLGTDVREIIAKRNPSVVFVADQHNWDASMGNPLAVKEEFFYGIEALADRHDIFKLTSVQDSHRQRESSKRHAVNAGCHTIVTYYHPSIVCHNLNWIRPQHVIRTWHTLDADKVPPFKDRQGQCLLSGSLGGAYPLRERIHRANLPNVAWLRHPGYVNTGSSTASYLQMLSQHRVAVCTSSRFGYALRKIMEAAACGCTVVTDLPTDDVLPEMDEFIVRVDPDIHLSDLRMQLQGLCDRWNPEKQKMMAEKAKARYDYRVEGKRLANEIEQLRINYSC